MIQRLRPGLAFLVGGVGVAAAVWGIACSSDSGNTVPETDGGSGSSTGSGGGSTTGSGGGSSTGTGTGSSAGTTTGSSTGTGTGSTTGSSTGASTGAATGSMSGSSTGTGMSPDGGCQQLTKGTVAVKVSIPVGWPSSLAGQAGEGSINIWFLTTLMLPAGSTMYTGVTKSCGTTLPDLLLSAAGNIAVGDGNVMGKVQLAILAKTFDAITRTFPTAGTQTGWNPGDMITETKFLGGLGLAATSKYLTDDTSAWPPDCAAQSTTCNTTGSFTAADLVDDDMNAAMHLGITVTPTPNANSNGYYLPPTAVGLGGSAPSSDLIYIALRQEIALSGTRMTSCTDGSGSATITLFDNHVVGCHVSGGGDCTSTQAQFLDTNRTKYTTKGSETAANPKPISASNPAMGTFTLKQIPDTSTCADARTMIP